MPVPGPPAPSQSHPSQSHPPRSHPPRIRAAHSRPARSRAALVAAATAVALPAAGAPAARAGVTDDVPFGQGAAVAHDPGGTLRSGAFAPDATSGTHRLPSAWPTGVDVSSWQHPGNAGINWRAVKKTGVRFAMVKATEGDGYTNPYFNADRHGAWNAGISVGAYHYARPALPFSTAVDQAHYFLSRSGDTRGTKQLAPVLDLEVTGGLTAEQLATWVRMFEETVETVTGRAPIIYTYRAFWTDIMANTPGFAGYPLWYAIYNGQASPGPLPGGWAGWTMWQYTSGGTVAGIRGAVDQNVFCCSLGSFLSSADGRASAMDRAYAASASLRALMGPPEAPEEPAVGGGRWRPFRNGLLYWSVATGNREVNGGIAKKYLALGGTASVLGRPLSDEFNAEPAGTRESRFQVGRIIWSRATGAHEVHGGILAKYLALGAGTSGLGLPVSDEYAVAGGRESAFQHGYLRWNAVTKVVTVVARVAP